MAKVTITFEDAEGENVDWRVEFNPDLTDETIPEDITDAQFAALSACQFIATQVFGIEMPPSM